MNGRFIATILIGFVWLLIFSLGLMDMDKAECAALNAKGIEKPHCL